MILVGAIAIGLAMGLLRLLVKRVPPQVPQFRFGRLVLIAGIPQVLVFHNAAVGRLLSDNQAALVLVLTQFLLLIFAVANWPRHGMKALAIGLLLNFVVIVANGGFMPIRPEALLDLVPQATSDMIHLGERLGTGKDIILPLEATRLWWLSDYFLLPDWLPYRVAYSIGDLFIAYGAWRMLWEIGGAQANAPSEPTRGSFKPTHDLAP